MRLYFVRHGETEDNAKRLYQSITSHLSKKGKKQAKIVAGRVKRIGVDLILSSPAKRTVETTEIINKDLGKKVIYLDELREIKRPRELEGKDWQSLEIALIRDRMRESFYIKETYVSDEENYFDLERRAKKFIEIVDSKFRKGSILVVTHGVILKMIMAYLMFRDELSPDIFRRFYHFLGTENTAVTVCEKNEDGYWQLITWNDFAHLG